MAQVARGGGIGASPSAVRQILPICSANRHHFWEGILDCLRKIPIALTDQVASVIEDLSKFAALVNLSTV
jgi:hypothetical protein